MTADEVTYLQWVCNVPLGITLCIFGLIGNIISVIVWTKIIQKQPNRTCSTSVFLIALAIADSGLLLCFLFTTAIKTSLPSISYSYNYNMFYAYFGFPMFFFFFVASIWLVVAVAVNRFIVVYFPMKAKSICTLTKTGISILVILLFCFVINIPHFFNYRVEKEKDENTTRLTYHLRETEYAKRGSAQKYVVALEISLNFGY